MGRKITKVGDCGGMESGKLEKQFVSQQTKASPTTSPSSTPPALVDVAKQASRLNFMPEAPG